MSAGISFQFRPTRASLFIDPKGGAARTCCSGCLTCFELAPTLSADSAIRRDGQVAAVTLGGHPAGLPVR